MKTIAAAKWLGFSPNSSIRQLRLAKCSSTGFSQASLTRLIKYHFISITRRVLSVANFASSVRFQVKTGQENAFLEAVMEFDASQHPGCVSHQVIDAGNGRFQSNVVWENEDAIAAARPNLIKFLDTIRPILAEISPELGVTDPISGTIVEK